MNDRRFDRLTRRAALRAGGAGLAVVIGAGASRPLSAQDATPMPAGMPAGAAPPSIAAPAGPLIVRKNASSLSSAEKRAFTDAVLALKLKPSPWAEGLSVYDTFVLWHRDAFNCDIMAAHMGPAFFPWHRAFLRLFEDQLRAIDPTVSLPYWDWTVDNTPDSPIWQADLMGGNGDPAQGYVITDGPFRQGKWSIAIFDYNDAQRNPAIIRDFGAGNLGPTLPTADDVEAALQVASYDAAPWNSMSPIASSFRNTFEGWRDCVQEICDPVVGMSPVCTGSHDLHNRVHLWVSGEFEFNHEDLTTSPIVGPGTPTPIPDATPAADGQTPGTSEVILGTMAANSSPSDPVFFLHHANIDRIWSEWIRRHGPTYAPVSGAMLGHNLNDAMWPYTEIGVTVTPAMLFDTRALGYAYDTEE